MSSDDLPPVDRGPLRWSLAWLRWVSWLVPRARRAEWLEEWQAELHARHAPLHTSSVPPSSLSSIREAWGAVPDALCLRTLSWRIDTMGTDLAFALRQILRRPGFAAIAVLTLAIGIGATTAIFSVVDTVLLRPLPYEEPGRLVALWETNPDRGWTDAELAPANFLDWKEQATSFETIAAYSQYPRQVILGEGAEPIHLQLGQASGDFFRTLRVEPALGRTFTAEETWNDGVFRVMMSHRLWRDRFAMDPGIVGSTVDLSGREVAVIGVLPVDFTWHAEPVDLWSTFGWSREQREAVWFRRAHMVRGVGRLAPGVTLETAQGELETIAKRLEAEYPVTNINMGAGAGSLHTWIVGDTRVPLFVLLGAVALVLMIACANVANLLLVRTANRVRELALRRALGAGRGRLIRQLLTESAVLAGLAALLGVAVAAGALQVLLAISPDDIPRLSQVSLDGRVLGFTTLLAALTVLLFGLAPAVLGVRRGNATGSARSNTASRREGRFRGALVVTEVALALVVVLATGLLGRSLWNLYRVDPGFASSHLLTTEIALPSAFYQDREAVNGFYGRLTDRLGQLPGVTSVSSTGMLPIDSTGWSGDLSVEGRGPGEHATEVRFAEIDVDYFATLGTELVAGREFRVDDEGDGPRVAMINESMQRLMFPDQDPLGARIASVRDVDENTNWVTIVGVVRDIHQFGVDQDPKPQTFFPLSQRWNRVRAMVLRIDADPLAVAPAMRTAVAELDPRLPASDVRTMSGVLTRSLSRERFLLAQLLAFGAVALLLAAVGTWSVLAYTVSQRRNEIGVRMAVGADRREVLRMVMAQGMRLVLLGFVIGLGAAASVNRFLETLLFGVDSFDLTTVLGTVAILSAVALLACVLPARTAARMDPTVSLRAE